MNTNNNVSDNTLADEEIGMPQVVYLDAGACIHCNMLSNRYAEVQEYSEKRPDLRLGTIIRIEPAKHPVTGEVTWHLAEIVAQRYAYVTPLQYNSPEDMNMLVAIMKQTGVATYVEPAWPDDESGVIYCFDNGSFDPENIQYALGIWPHDGSDEGDEELEEEDTVCPDAAEHHRPAKDSSRSPNAQPAGQK